jgi:group I intron endonuclease
LQRAYNKYGADLFSFVVLEKCAPCDLINLEQSYLDLSPHEYNINPTARSMFGYRHSDETKRKIGASSIGRLHTEEEKRKMSEAQRGEKNHFFGKHHSEEQKQRVSNSMKGKGRYWLGKHPSEESNQKRSATMKAFRERQRLEKQNV